MERDEREIQVCTMGNMGTISVLPVLISLRLTADCPWNESKTTARSLDPAADRGKMGYGATGQMPSVSFNRYVFREIPEGREIEEKQCDDVWSWCWSLCHTMVKADRCDSDKISGQLLVLSLKGPWSILVTSDLDPRGTKISKRSFGGFVGFGVINFGRDSRPFAGKSCLLWIPFILPFTN